MDYCNQDFIPQKDYGNQQITIMYINDIHGDVVRIGKMLTAEKYFSKQNKKSTRLILAGGDLYLGKNKSRNNAVTKILNLTKLEYTAPGNHEFDGGSEYLSSNLKKAKFKVIGTNLVIPDGNKLKERLKDKKLVRSDVIIKNGTKFGLLGAAPSDKDIGALDNHNKISAMNIEDTIKAINNEAKKLEEAGINRIILLSHEGYGCKGDIKIAEETEGIDIIIGGHTHTVIDGINENGKLKNLVYSKRCEPVVITQAGSDNANVGYLDVLFDTKGRIIKDKIKNKIVSLDKYESSSKADRILKRAVGENEVITKVDIPFIPQEEKEERETENPSANILTEGMLRRGRTAGAEVALINAPSMKSSKVNNELTTYDVKYRMLPYNDNIIVISLTEKQFVDLLNMQAKTIINEGGSQMLHCAGMKYTISKKEARANKTCVKDICIKDKTGEYTRKIDEKNPSSTKRVICAINDYLPKESRLEPIFKGVELKKVKKVGREQEIFIEQIKINGGYKAVKDGRITVESI